MIVQDVVDLLQQAAPFETQLSFDNAGLLIGSPWQQVAKVGVVLDVTASVLEWAKIEKVDLLVCHHPLIFHGIKQIAADSVVYQAIQQGVAVLAVHTNLDAAAGGVNDALASALELKHVQPLALPEEPAAPPMGRIGCLTQSMAEDAFAAYVKDKLHTHVKYVPVGRPVQRVAVCGGAGEDFILPAVSAGAQALVTAEVKHHNLLTAASLSFMVIDAGHFETEQVVIAPLVQLLQSRLSVSVLAAPQQSPVLYC